MILILCKKMEITSLYTSNNDGKGKRKYFMYVKTNLFSIIELSKDSYKYLRTNAINEGFKVIKCKYRNELLEKIK